MSNNRRPAVFWISTWWPVALATTAILLESTATMGANHTAGPLHRLLVWIFGPISEPTFDLLHFLFRKTGHFVGYGLVGLSWLRAGWRIWPGWKYPRCLLFGLAGAFTTACLDEWHQSFLPNREGCFRDVLIDTVGACALAALVWIFLKAFRPGSLQRAA